MLYLSRNCPFFLHYSILWSTVFICCYVSIFISDYVNFDVFSLFLFISLDKGFSILLIFFSEPYLCFIDCIVFFASILLISALNWIISCLLLLLGESASFFPRDFRCPVESVVRVFST